MLLRVLAYKRTNRHRAGIHSPRLSIGARRQSSRPLGIGSHPSHFLIFSTTRNSSGRFFSKMPKKVRRIGQVCESQYARDEGVAPCCCLQRLSQPRLVDATCPHSEQNALAFALRQKLTRLAERREDFKSSVQTRFSYSMVQDLKPKLIKKRSTIVVSGAL